MNNNTGNAIELVVFDIAGTTVKDNGEIAKAFQSALNEHGYDVPVTKINPLMGYKKTEAIKKMLTEFEPHEDKITEEYIDQIHDRFLKLMIDYYSTASEITPLPHTEEVFSLLKEKQVKIGLDTGFSKEITNIIIDRLGRRQTEFMGAVLAVSFIFSSGVVKSVGKSLIINYHVSEMWMPFFTGGLFVLPMLLFTWLLNHLPPPSDADIALRSARKPMTSEERKSFLAMFLPGIILIVSTYVLLTILRDFRDNFANELWTELGFKNQASIFTETEIPVSLIVLLSMSMLVVVKDNIKAFMINHYIILGGYVLALVSTLLFQAHHMNAVVWMIMIGTGLYLGYVPFNALYFERMIASYKVKGNVGFIMYIADAFGYLGSVLVLFAKQFFGFHISWTSFFVNAVFTVCTFGIAGTIIAAIYFRNKYYTNQRNITTVYAA